MNFLKAKFNSTSEESMFDPSVARRRRSTVNASGDKPFTSSRHSRTSSAVSPTVGYGVPIELDIDELTTAIWDTWNKFATFFFQKINFCNDVVEN